MTGIDRLRAQVEGGTTANLVLPRALMRDILRQIEREAEPAGTAGDRGERDAERDCFDR